MEIISCFSHLYFLIKVLSWIRWFGTWKWWIAGTALFLFLLSPLPSPCVAATLYLQFVISKSRKVSLWEYKSINNEVEVIHFSCRSNCEAWLALCHQRRPTSSYKGRPGVLSSKRLVIIVYSCYVKGSHIWTLCKFALFYPLKTMILDVFFYQAGDFWRRLRSA